MASGKIPGVRQVRKKEVHELSKLPWVLDEALSDRAFEARLLADGRVLLVLRGDGSGTLYPSREPLAQTQRGTREEIAKGPVDPTLTLLPPIDELFRDVEAHAKSLGPRLHIPDEALDGSVVSLDAVDKAIKRIPRAERPVADLVTPLVAYVGEVMRKANGGQWIKRSPTYQVRTPVFDPAELAAWQEAQAVGQRAFTAVQQQGRGGSSPEAFDAARKAMEATGVREPKPLRYETVEHTRTGSGQR